MASLRQKDGTGRTIYVGDRVTSKFDQAGKVIGLISVVQQEIIRGGILYHPTGHTPFVHVMWEDESDSCIAAKLLTVTRPEIRGDK